MKNLYSFILLTLFIILYHSPGFSETANTIQHYGYKIINTFPHDPEAWTQGLVFENGLLYESTGRCGFSSLRRVEPETGKVLKIRILKKKFYGEGLTLFNNMLIQLTWQNHTGFIYDKSDFSLIKTFSYPVQGWGITHDGTNLIMSDGSSTLRFLDPETLKQVRQITVTANGSSLRNLNELEYIEGKIYANVWFTDNIAIISPNSGEVVGIINLKGLFPEENRVNADSVLNGIAYDEKKKHLFVTGKLWPRLFEIEVVK